MGKSEEKFFYSIYFKLILFFIHKIFSSNILYQQAAESGDLENFIRLYQGDNGRLMVTDARGRTATHLAASKNRVNILQYIYAQEGSEYKKLIFYRSIKLKN